MPDQNSIEAEPLLTRPQNIKNINCNSATGSASWIKSVKLRDKDAVTSNADPGLVRAAADFVADVIEKAKVEAAKRLKAQRQRVTHETSEKVGGNLGRGPWKKRWNNFVHHVYRVFWSCVGTTYYS